MRDAANNHFAGELIVGGEADGDITVAVTKQSVVGALRQSFREPVTVASTGGKDGGGMLVTEFGDALIHSYRQLERDLATSGGRTKAAKRTRDRE